MILIKWKLRSTKESRKHLKWTRASKSGGYTNLLPSIDADLSQTYQMQLSWVHSIQQLVSFKFILGTLDISKKHPKQVSLQINLSSSGVNRWLPAINFIIRINRSMWLIKLILKQISNSWKLLILSKTPFSTSLMIYTLIVRRIISSLLNSILVKREICMKVSRVENQMNSIWWLTVVMIQIQQLVRVKKNQSSTKIALRKKLVLILVPSSVIKKIKIK